MCEERARRAPRRGLMSRPIPTSVRQMHPAQTIMSAYYRRRGEDRFTEVFAAVLNRSVDLLHGLVDRVGLERADLYEVRTQVNHEGVTIDLEVTGRAANGSVAWLLWSEHKVDDPLTIRPLQSEFEALGSRATSARGHLIAITRYAPTPEVRAHALTIGCTLLGWREVTSIARAARQRAGASALPTGIQEQLLEEWISFATHELEAPMEALTPERVRLLPEAEKALDTIEHLLTAGFSHACEEFGASAPRERDGELHANPPEGSWLADRSFRLYAKQVGDDGFGDIDGPCLVVGAWIEGDDAASARRSREFHAALAERGLAIWDEDDRHGGWIEFGVAIALTELATHRTLEEQQQVFAQVALRALRALSARPA